MSTVKAEKISTPIQFATCIGLDVRVWLMNTRTPRILNVFDRAINLINEHGDIMSLVSIEIGNGPFNMVISPQAAGLIFNQIDSRSSISICWPKLNIGHVSIDFHQANLWNAKPDWARLIPFRQLMVSNLLLRSEWLVSQAHPDSLLSLTSNMALIPGRETENYTDLRENSALENIRSTTIIGEWMRPLFEAVHSIDLDSCRQAAQSVAGLGLGLTPAGDDFLLGAMHAAWIIHPEEKSEVITSTLATSAIPLTTSLSGAWLQAAARGLVNQPWMDFLETWIIDGQASIESSLRRLLSIGNTSGADSLAGFIGCLVHGMASLALKIKPTNQNEYRIKDRILAVPLWD